MSSNIAWDVEKYREEHESEEHWQLRKAFMERWKDDYSEDRLVCLARVFTNMEFMGCRYPPEVMHEVAGLSHEVAHEYRQSRKTKLQRTFVSASTAAEDRAKGLKRHGGSIVDGIQKKSNKIEFVSQGHNLTNTEDSDEVKINEDKNEEDGKDIITSKSRYINQYMAEMLNVKCLNVKQFREDMFETQFGRFALVIRSWSSKMCIIQTSFLLCGLKMDTSYEDGCFSILVKGKLLAQAKGDNKAEAKTCVEKIAWAKLRDHSISVVVKEQWIAQGDSRISMGDVSGRSSGDMFGTPIENTVATKMMKMMGWKGGGLGADAQGIAEPIKPNLQMIHRAGLGSIDLDIRQLRRAADQLMQRYISSDTLDVDLVFSSEFSKEERAALHQSAQRAKLASKSYGTDKDRFLVVRKKINPFSLIRAVIEKGGVTPKYQVFIPSTLLKNGR